MPTISNRNCNKKLVSFFEKFKSRDLIWVDPLSAQHDLLCKLKYFLESLICPRPLKWMNTGVVMTDHGASYSVAQHRCWPECEWCATDNSAPAPVGCQGDPHLLVTVLSGLSAQYPDHSWQWHTHSTPLSSLCSSSVHDTIIFNHGKWENNLQWEFRSDRTRWGHFNS